MRSVDLSNVTWRKSSYSNPDGGECLEVADPGTATLPLIPVRDSKNPTGPALLFPAAAWSTFIDEVKTGR
ncbi:DUF397 domain-containing protein [Streptomyces sp. NPDC051909]|uniref:DUF397 domain-containing protein n=1 Tax=Streptomyces sp. NPDC051909 TaxID=3154944 RepID=UPI003429C54B